MPTVAITQCPANNAFFGAPITSSEKARDKYAYHLNETPSLRSEPMANRLQAVTVRTITTKLKTTKREIHHLARANFEVLSSPDEQMRVTEADIEQAAEKRVASFYQQLILAYGTNLHFEIGKVTHQAESCETIHIQADGSTDKTKIKFDATHTSAIPCLYAYPLDQWTQYKEFGQLQLEQLAGVVFLKGSDAYNFWNSTIDLPFALNHGVDIPLDQKAGKLQEKGIELLNQVASGAKEPTQALEEFIEEFLYGIDSVAPKNSAAQKGLEIYKKVVEEIRDSMNQDAAFFQHLLGLPLNVEDSGVTCVRAALFDIRYKAIQQNAQKQSEIAQKFDQVRAQIAKDHKGLAHREEGFRELLIDAMPTEVDGSRIKKLLNIPYDLRTLEERKQRTDSAKVKLWEKVSTKKEIEELAKYLSDTMGDMRKREVSERASVMKKIREIRGWTQKKLAEKIQTLRLPMPASQSTISRCETGKRMVDSVYAGQLSRVFDVSSVLFLPLFFHD